MFFIRIGTFEFISMPFIIRKMLERNGPFAHESFEASSQILDFVRENMKLLVVGAGGLGCELLKDLALMGFRYEHLRISFSLYFTTDFGQPEK